MQALNINADTAAAEIAAALSAEKLILMTGEPRPARSALFSARAEMRAGATGGVTETRSARTLVCPDVMGVLRDKDDPSTLIPEVRTSLRCGCFYFRSRRSRGRPQVRNFLLALLWRTPSCFCAALNCAQVSISGVRKLIKDGIVAGGMIPKVQCAVRAVAQARAHECNSRAPGKAAA